METPTNCGGFFMPLMELQYAALIASKCHTKCIVESLKNVYIYSDNMKKTLLPLFYLTLFLLQSFCFAQGSVVDSLKQELKKATQDTTRCNILNQMVEAESDDAVWPLYNEELKKIAENNLKTNLSASLKKVFLKHLSGAYNNIGYGYIRDGKTKEAIESYTKCIEIQTQIGDKKEITNSLCSLGNIYRRIGDAPNALKHYERSLKISQEINDKSGVALSLFFIGWAYDDKGDIPNALDYYQRSLKIAEQSNDQSRMALCLNNIAYIYNNQQDTKTALEYYTKSLKLNETIGNPVGTATAMNNIGNIFYKLSELDKALSYYERSFKKFESINDKNGIGYSYNNLGNVYSKQGNLEKAQQFYEQSLTIRKEIQDMQGVSASSSNLAEINLKQKKYSVAEKLGVDALKIAQEIGYPEGIKSAASVLCRAYEKQNNGLSALQMHRLFIKMRDSLDNIATQKAVITQYAKHMYERKAAEDSVRVAEEKKVTAIQLKQERTQRYSLYFGLLLVLIFAGVLFNRFRITQRQKQIIEKQKEEVDAKQKEIVQSITYAKRLQEAILPPLDFINTYLPENFIYYQPKDIVAGDFYWAEKINNQFFIAAADSTGHGVPGAMVSVVCSNALNRSVKEFHLTDVGAILTKTRELVLETFEKSTSEVKDGMDISLLCIDKVAKTVSWSGANNPLWFFQNNGFNEIKPDKQPIGKTDDPMPFTTQVVPYVEGTVFYLFTDGYADQFGGSKGKKLKYKQFSALLAEVHSLPTSAQKEKLNAFFTNWKGNLEQVDDVCVLGIKL